MRSAPPLNLCLQGGLLALTVQLASGLDGVLRLPWRNLGGGWIGKQRRYGGR